MTLNLDKNNGNDSDFNSHAHVERDSMYDTDEYTMENFNSHAHVERD